MSDDYDAAKNSALSYLAALEDKRQRGSMGNWEGPKLYCSECDRYERDPVFLDVERCSKCGEPVEGADDD